jgi:acyl carrier protein
MASADSLLQQSKNNIRRLGLSAIPFTESPTGFDDTAQLDRTFTGRKNELSQVFNLFQGLDRRRILIYGRIGIGKSAFLLEALTTLKEDSPKKLFTYTSLPAELDLATAALIALAQELPNDDWAQNTLHQMGIPTAKAIKERSREVGGSLGLNAKVTEKNAPQGKLQYPTAALDTLIDRALKKYPEGVVIAIDDLDKQNPARVRQLMHDAQGILKGRAWFMLTAHPIGMTANLLTTERGLFDLRIELKELDQETTYQMLVNYLNSVRIGKPCTDPNDPNSVLPFSPEAARHFCQVSKGKPRLFNRLGTIILDYAANQKADKITFEVLQAGLRMAAPKLQEQAALKFQEERVRKLLQERSSLSDETITIEDLEQLGFSSYSDLLPILEKLEDADLAYRTSCSDAQEFAAIDLPFGEFIDTE